ncbi:MAG TPA: xanthine dehydrogenase, partial [Saprospiraceae bacterium]|nr:xanthine dehydrogenase [Saprospiraceae bacterium]
MKNIDSKSHVTGKSIYLDDIPTRQGTLYAAVFSSPIAHGWIESIDFAQAFAMPGVVQIISHKDIPGENQIGGIFPDEELLAKKELHFQGQPIAVVIADTEQQAFDARKKIILKFTERKAIVDAREAQAQNSLIMPPRTFRKGDTKNAWKDCTYIFEGRAKSNGQEHLYLETQGAYAYPLENGNIKIHSSTQSPTAVQRTTAQVLNIGMHHIEVDVQRLGGGFGGKEDQATPWAVMAALGVQVLNKPVKLVLNRIDDMRMTGKRHPYDSDYKIGLSKDLKILAFEATMYQNAGAAADLSPAILGRSLFHSTNSYFIPNTKVTAYSCKTNLPPNTAFRGFGGPQGMFVIESALAHAARELKIPTYKIQHKNLLKTGDELPYGQKIEGGILLQIWKNLVQKFDLQSIENQIDTFNKSNTHFKKGFSLMPVTFGISFTKTPMNQARALVHIYSDGSIGISTGAIEMGQGVNTKLLQVAAQVFSVSANKIKLESTNTTRVANTSPTAASTGADLNGKALEMACNALLARLKTSAGKSFGVSPDDISIQDEIIYQNGIATSMNWTQLIDQAFLERVNLTENAHYATPVIHYDMSIEKGIPFAYHVYGLALTEVTVDCLRGTYEIDTVKIVHDFGKSMNPTIDFGQVEGAL